MADKGENHVEFELDEPEKSSTPEHKSPLLHDDDDDDDDDEDYSGVQDPYYAEARGIDEQMLKNFAYAEFAAEKRANEAEKRANEKEKSLYDELDASTTNSGKAALLGAKGKRKRAKKYFLKKEKMRKVAPGGLYDK
ncbi:hypothetical protein QL285_019956 [Trifolium repens]|nr:hypothetical protein QL285_019956 [Trifolium repens]